MELPENFTSLHTKQRKEDEGLEQVVGVPQEVRSGLELIFVEISKLFFSELQTHDRTCTAPFE